MDIESSYLAARKLTQEMLVAATALDWATLAQLETQRAALLASTPPLSTLSTLQLSPAQASHLAAIIAEMERDNVEILDIANVAQAHTRILLRMDKEPAAVV